MAAHLSKDLINGTKMIIHSAQVRHSRYARARIFIGGLLLNLVTTFVLYTSTIYNKAIATSNTDIIVNAVIILFITDIDEFSFVIIEAINQKWVMRRFKEEGIKTIKYDNCELGSKVKALEETIESLEDTIETMNRRIEELIERIDVSHDRSKDCDGPER